VNNYSGRATFTFWPTPRIGLKFGPAGDGAGVVRKSPWTIAIRVMILGSVI